ncbi:EF-hand domain-containing protein [Thiobacillus sp.]|uniref:EF-hand domain-containing protein n=1 Tax=Thiobacillus sp. TaxID=924 RepID=UPI00286DF126|nr:EF-hand domain-containing protein [Thiobacillus sp.]
MKSKTSTPPTLIAVALVGLALQPAYAAEAKSVPPTPAASAASLSFKTLDTDKDGYLSIKEFTAKGLDDLAFRAADIDSDGQVDPDEYGKYSQLKANDPLKSGSGNAAPTKPGDSAPKPTRYPSGY